MNEIVIAGNPNTGKTTVFNMLTNSGAKTGNWHGVTVTAASAPLVCDTNALITDVPGLYSLKGYSMEERLAAGLLLKKQYLFALAMCDAGNLERGLKLVSAMLTAGIKTALIINFSGELKKNGGSFDIAGFKRRAPFLPVFVIDKPNGRCARELRIFTAALISEFPHQQPCDFSFLQSVYNAAGFKEGIADKILLNPYLALPVFFALLAAVFYITFGKNMPGEYAKNLLETFIGTTLKQRARVFLYALSAPPWLIGLIADAIIGGAGMLIAFVPQIGLLFLFLTLMEESGYISRLAFMTDGIFSRAGLTGRAVFSMLMGFGCSAAAILTTKGFESRSLQKRTVFVIPYISCSAKLPVYSMLAAAFFGGSFIFIMFVYALGAVFALTGAAILKRVYPETEPFIIELPPYRVPPPLKLVKLLLNHIKQFIIKIGGAVMAFIILMWFLMSFTPALTYLQSSSQGSMLAYIGGLIKYIFYPIGIKSWEISAAMLGGLIAKETVAGILAVMYPQGLSGAFSASSALALTVFIMTYTTCISAITATARELSLKTALKLAALQFLSALLFSYITYFLCMVILKYGYAYFAGGILFAVIIIWAVLRLKKEKCRGCGRGCTKCANLK